MIELASIFLAKLDLIYGVSGKAAGINTETAILYYKSLN